MASTLAAGAENATQARILRHLRDGGPLSRVELAERIGTSRTTVATEVSRLAELGLVDDIGPGVSRGGRRATLVDLAGRLRFVGVDVGATSLTVGVTDGRLQVLVQREEELDVRRGAEHVLGRALELTRKLLAEQHLTRPAGLGIGLPGPVNFHAGTPVAPPIMPGWDGYPVREVLARELGCHVLVDNDVNAMALGELHAGVARSARDFLFVKIGTGIGCGIVVDGRLYRGVDGCAGDIGHIQAEESGPACACGNSGCLEAFFGGAALARDAAAAARSGRSPELAALAAASGAPLTAADVGTAARHGDQAALALIRDGGRRVGTVLAGLVSFFNPGLVVIGGGVSGLGHLLLAEIRGVVYRRSLPLATGNLPVVLTELGDAAGIVGAARLASDALYSPD
ncbi:ROK family transcriptional regulator [Frankia sp. CNm7]|uniref:ROK family transcriptional regulator n=1 Tax=Frankia nepalensis TaxID=1836974 RepID=A0A937RKR9_9ACTN|nr:ROK family transcriptional regulator [Frankia nepalensis]MBL7499707.1 ROK family transcriptional regulator [Frankia nepalensis]MBL7515001.1 ROK family transcriptional regulator [Frankia nepalensis]MBL7521984.1 ROK family transcriptional regulator [Frankia nepalensis]MBL7629139.1 ROK family transcriptional regulator [Frankia nepalensis]